jgi:thioredoxin 1
VTLSAMNAEYAAPGPSRAEIERLAGPAMLEFGSPGCGYCRMAQPLAAAALAGHPDVRHIKVEDASGRPLGRSFNIKLWPTFVFLRNGREVARVVRPRDERAIAAALASIDIPE